MTTNETPALYEELEKLLDRISNDCMSTLIDLSGNLMDIDSGTLIKIPSPVGFVKLYKSADSWKLSCWNSTEILDSLKTNDET